MLHKGDMKHTLTHRTVSTLIRFDDDTRVSWYGVYRAVVRVDGSWNLNAPSTRDVAVVCDDGRRDLAPDILACRYATLDAPALTQQDMEQLAKQHAAAKRHQRRLHRELMFDLNGHHGPA